MSMRMVLPRPDLDGRRLNEPGKPEVWLVFGGERHQIASSTVYDSLFSEVTGLLPYEGVEWITEGPVLEEGTCLIRADETLSIYLVTRRFNGQVVRHFIPTYESLVDFGFDQGKVRNVPPLVVEGLHEGVELTSAADRDARR
ncbi:MAG: hypothetical protein M3M95_07145 [Pseudomonadota bacterium]|nr:hypothetical protein [Pseudomonadota bacterium]